MKLARDVLQDLERSIEKRDGAENRKDRGQMLDQLRVQVVEWVELFTKRGLGPSHAEMEVVVRDLDSWVDLLRDLNSTLDAQAR